VRPISPIFCFLKILEKLILNRLYWIIESFNYPIFSNFQFDFRKFRLCQDNLSILTAAIHEGLGFANCAVFVDIKSAFDNFAPHSSERFSGTSISL